MEWLIIITILLVGYLVGVSMIRNSPSSKAKEQEKQIALMDLQANTWLEEVYKFRGSQIKEAENELSQLVDKEDKSLKKDDLKREEEDLARLKELEKKYIILNERFKFDSVDKRFELVKDWYDLMENFISSKLDHEHHTQFLDYYVGMPREERESEFRIMEERGIRGREIIKRMEARLKA